MERKPCRGNGYCCNRPEFDRTLFPCDETAALWSEFVRLRADLRRVTAERDAARAVLLSVSERLAAASEVIGRRAYRKEGNPCPHCLTLR